MSARRTQDPNRPRCEVCGRLGSFDMTKAPAHYRNEGRRSQGAMTPLWAPAEFSPSLGMTLCIECFKPRFAASVYERRKS